MTPHEVDLARIAEICRRYGIARLEVFGSAGRGEARPDSDIDLLYTLAPDAHLGWNISALEDELGDALGCRVDLVSRRALHPRLRDAVLAEARPLYAA